MTDEITSMMILTVKVIKFATDRAESVNAHLKITRQEPIERRTLQRKRKLPSGQCPAGLPTLRALGARMLTPAILQAFGARGRLAKA